MWPFANLKGFANNRPPLVIFLICLCAFGVVLLTLAFIIETKENIKDPDLSADWNVFLDSFAKLQFCLADSPFENNGVLSGGELKTKNDEKSEVLPMTAPNTDKSSVEKFSVVMKMTVHPTQEFLNISRNHTHLFGKIMGHQLGLPGAASKSPMNVTFSLPNSWNGSLCQINKECEPFTVDACVTLEANNKMFPITRSPESCSIPSSNITDHHGFIRAYKDYALVDYYWCRQQTKLLIDYESNPTLTVMISSHDRSIITLHLMHTSCFVFVMVVTMIFYAMVRGRPSDIKYHPVSVTHE